MNGILAISGLSASQTNSMRIFVRRPMLLSPVSWTRTSRTIELFWRISIEKSRMSINDRIWKSNGWWFILWWPKTIRFTKVFYPMPTKTMCFESMVELGKFSLCNICLYFRLFSESMFENMFAVNPLSDSVNNWIFSQLWFWSNTIWNVPRKDW